MKRVEGQKNKAQPKFEGLYELDHFNLYLSLHGLAAREGRPLHRQVSAYLVCSMWCPISAKI